MPSGIPGAALPIARPPCARAGARVTLPATDPGCHAPLQKAHNPDLRLLDGVLISHGHRDHIAGLLELYGMGLYDGPWYGLPESGALVELTLSDAVRLHRQELGD